jgi:excisionase family DNA binding protein
VVDRVADERLTIREAAVRLGVSESAVRKRIERGTLRHDKGSNGRVYVYLGTVADATTDTTATNESNALISRLEDEVAFLRRELEHKDHLLAAALERIPPPIEPPPEAPESPATPPVKPKRAEPTEPEDLGRVEPKSVEPEKAENRPATAEAQEGAQRSSASGRARRILPMLLDLVVIMVVLFIVGWVILRLVAAGSL